MRRIVLTLLVLVSACATAQSRKDDSRIDEDKGDNTPAADPKQGTGEVPADKDKGGDKDKDTLRLRVPGGTLVAVARRSP